MRKGTDFEHAFIRKEEAKGWHCERVAGSGSRKEAICDVVLFREGMVFLVEVKSTLEKKFYTSGKPEQFRKLREIALAHGVIPLLAVRFKWRVWAERDLTKGVPKIVECGKKEG